MATKNILAFIQEEDSTIRYYYTNEGGGMLVDIYDKMWGSYLGATTNFQTVDDILRDPNHRNSKVITDSKEIAKHQMVMELSR